MRSIALGVAAACLAVGVAAAQTGSTSGTSPGATSGAGTGMGTAPAAPASPTRMPGMSHDPAAASGNNNQAVATTDANAPVPAKGSNSFTQSQARSRIEKHGFSHVTDLKKDDNGVWRGHGTKGGQTVAVWLDYKGNVGQ